MDPSIRLVLHLQDGTPVDLLVRQDVRAESVVLSALRKIGVRETSVRVLLGCFALQECLDGDTLGPPLKATEHVLDALASWRAREAAVGVARLYLVLRLVTPGVLGASSSGGDVALQHLLFITCVHAYMQGLLPVSVESAAQLAGILLLVRQGPYDATRHRMGFCAAPGTLDSLVPLALHPKRSLEVWEDLLLSAYAKLGSLTNVALAKELFSGALEELELFSCAHFEATQKFSAALPRALTLCISSEGVFVADRTPEHPVLQRIPLQALQVWSGLSDGEGGSDNTGFLQLTVATGAPGSRSWLGLSGLATQVLLFSAQHGGEAAGLMNNYAEQLMRELVEERKGTGSSGAGGGAGAGEGAGVAAVASAETGERVAAQQAEVSSAAPAAGAAGGAKEALS